MKDIRLKQAVSLSLIFLIAIICQNCTSVPTSSRASSSVERTSPVLEHLSSHP